MTRTRLVQLVDDQVAESLVHTITRTVDRMADTMAEELLRDPQTRADLQTLVRDAFARAVAALNDPPYEAERQP
jgi:O-methyltransferase involved in polyketide biosynthesis